jgi:hypothetical protein
MNPARIGTTEVDYFSIIEEKVKDAFCLIPTPWATPVADKHHTPKPFAMKPTLPPPGPIAEVVHAPAGSPPRYVRRHWKEEATITKRGTVARRTRKAYARINRMAKGARP